MKLFVLGLCAIYVFGAHCVMCRPVVLVPIV